MSRRALTYLALAAAGLLVGFGVRPLGRSPAATTSTLIVGQAPARPATPESRRLAERVTARRAESPGAEPVKLEFHPRAADEWQGMRVMTNQPQCATSESCGLGLACVQGRCGPCRDDGQCLAGERCAVDHCVPAAGLSCRSAHDCQGGEKCVLSGYSADPRGNTGMKSACLAGGGDNPLAEAPAPAATDERPARVDFGDFTPPQQLLDSL
jgi:hypothetical protein